MNLRCYTDGSYFMKADPGRTYGSMIMLDEKEEEVLCWQRYITEEKALTSMHSAGGECLAAMTAMTVAGTFISALQGVDPEHARGNVTILHDYNGVEHFVTKYFKAEKKGSQIYLQAVRDFKQKYPNVNIFFKKVKAHSGNRWNEMADALAKGIEPYYYADVGLPPFTY